MSVQHFEINLLLIIEVTTLKSLVNYLNILKNIFNDSYILILLKNALKFKIYIKKN